MARFLHQLGYLVRETGQALDRLGCSMQGSLAFKEQLSRHRTVMNLFDKKPALSPSAFVAPSASVIGDVTIGEKSSIWYNAVLRGDVNKISIGSYTNIQDGTVVHVSRNNVGGRVLPTTIGSKVTVGHGAVLHACTIQDESFVGMGATLLDGVVVEKGAMVAAGATVTPGARVPAGQIWAGAPAKFLRSLTPEESAFIAQSATNYATLAESHATECAKSAETIEAEAQARLDREGIDVSYHAEVGIPVAASAAAAGAH